jgi:uncharacterized protein YecE (DUF72 family)
MPCARKCPRARLSCWRYRVCEHFLSRAREYRYVFEFRHDSWYDEQIFQILRDHEIALCLSDHAAAPSPWIVTAQHVYVRGPILHSPIAQGEADCLRFFDNDQKNAASGDAKRLLQRLDKLSPKRSRTYLEMQSVNHGYLTSNGSLRRACQRSPGCFKTDKRLKIAS